MIPDFTARITGALLSPWEDPASGGQASRLTGDHLRQVVAVGATATVIATVGGVSGPPDLAGRLFETDVVEYPGAVKPDLLDPLLRTSIRTFVATLAGHYTITMRRQQSGVFFLHLDAV